MDTFFEMGSLSLSGPGCQSQSRRLLKEKKKASYSSQIPEMSRHPWEARAMKQNMVMKEESHDWVPWKNKTSYYIKKSHFMFPLEQRGGGVDRVRSAGCRQRRWPGISTYFSIHLLRLSKDRHDIPQSRHIQKEGPLVCSQHLWVCFFFAIFTSLLYFLDSTYMWHHTVFVLLCLIYFT